MDDSQGTTILRSKATLKAVFSPEEIQSRHVDHVVYRKLIPNLLNSSHGEEWFSPVAYELEAFRRRSTWEGSTALDCVQKMTMP